MKNFSGLVLFILSLLPLDVMASGIEGERFLNQWAGEYKIINCIECPDHVIEGGSNLKNFLWFGIGVFEIPKEDLLACAQVQVSVGFSYAVQADNARPNDGTSISSLTGQCDWSNNESLRATATTFDYERQGLGNGSKVKLSITQATDGVYEILREEMDSTPSWGLPTSWKYRAQATKVVP